MSQLTAQATEEVFGQEGGGFLTLLVLTHSILGTPLRFVNNNSNITSNGLDYIAYPFKVKLPEERTDAAPLARLTIANVDRQITQAIRQIATPISCDISLIRISDLDVVEVTLPTFQLRNVEGDFLQISGDLVLDDLTKEPFPQRTFTPAEYPGVFVT